MDYSELKKALAQARDRFNQTAQGQIGPPLPEYTPEETAVADAALGTAMGTIKGPDVAKAAAAEKRLADAFKFQKAQREMSFAERNAKQIAEKLGREPEPVTPPHLRTLGNAAGVAKEAAGGLRIKEHIANNPDMATTIENLAKRVDPDKLESLAGPDGKFQRIRAILDQRNK